MKLNTKTQYMNVVSDENFAKLLRYESFTANASEDNERPSDEQVYHTGANHAFIDSISMIEHKDVSRKTAVDGNLLTGVVIVTVAVVLYKPAKKVALKLKKKFRG
jgi:hypothetical protein